MRNGRDEYNDIFDPAQVTGFEFTYGSRHLGKSKPISQSEMGRIEPTKCGNQDDVPLYVRCRKCGAYMDFTNGPTGMMDGKWICPTCGVGVRERSVFNQLERENEEFLNDMDSDDYDEYW